MKVAVIGAGSWGTAVTWVLGQKGHDVSLWARNPEVARTITEEHFNPRYLSSVRLADCVSASSDIAIVLSGAEAVVVVTPSSVARETAEHLRPFIAENTPVVILSKGVEHGTNLLMVDVFEEVLGNRSRLAVLSGPNHAEEISRGIPSATVVASDSPETAAFFQNVFITPEFRVYTSDDVIGVEICAAAKNIIAIANGMAVGMGFGDNTTALLMTRGLAEMSRLCAAMGGDPMTCMGLAGMGDLIATCTSHHSRNRTLGELIARGGTLEEFTAQTHMVAEGAIACINVAELAAQHGVELPIANTVRGVLWEGYPLEKAKNDLLARLPGDEFAKI